MFSPNPYSPATIDAERRSPSITRSTQQRPLFGTSQHNYQSPSYSAHSDRFSEPLHRLQRQASNEHIASPVFRRSPSRSQSPPAGTPTQYAYAPPFLYGQPLSAPRPDLQGKQLVSLSPNERVFPMRKGTRAPTPKVTDINDEIKEEPKSSEPRDAFATRSVHWSPDLVKEITVPRKEPLYPRSDLAKAREALLASPTTTDASISTDDASENEATSKAPNPYLMIVGFPSNKPASILRALRKHYGQVDDSSIRFEGIGVNWLHMRFIDPKSAQKALADGVIEVNATTRITIHRTDASTLRRLKLDTDVIEGDEEKENCVQKLTFADETVDDEMHASLADESTLARSRIRNATALYAEKERAEKEARWRKQMEEQGVSFQIGHNGRALTNVPILCESLNTRNNL